MVYDTYKILTSDVMTQTESEGMEKDTPNKREGKKKTR